MKLVFCFGGNSSYPPIAKRIGWFLGARLPHTIYHRPIYFADQDWRKFNGLKPGTQAYEKNLSRYLSALDQEKPEVASVIDWEEERTESEVMRWAESAASSAGSMVMVIPKTEIINRIPREVAGKKVILGYSVPTTHGKTEVNIESFAGWPVHLLGGSPKQQVKFARLLAREGCEIVSADGNILHKAAQFGGVYQNGGRRQTTLDAERCIELSLKNIPEYWKREGFRVELNT